jgi:hypothetical protein
MSKPDLPPSQFFLQIGYPHSYQNKLLGDPFLWLNYGQEHHTTPSFHHKLHRVFARSSEEAIGGKDATLLEPF